MSLPHALMVSLIEKSCSGYDLAKRFSQSIGFFWGASHQQIYRELAKMEQQGWISSHNVVSNKTKKRIYSVESAGEEELKRWSSIMTNDTPLRNAFVVRLRAAAIFTDIDILKEVQHRITMHEQQITHYKYLEYKDFIERSQKDPNYMTRTKSIQYLILKAGIRNEEAALQACYEIYALLTKDN